MTNVKKDENGIHYVTFKFENKALENIFESCITKRLTDEEIEEQNEQIRQNLSEILGFEVPKFKSIKINHMPIIDNE